MDDSYQSAKLMEQQQQISIQTQDSNDVKHVYTDDELEQVERQLEDIIANKQTLELHVPNVGYRKKLEIKAQLLGVTSCTYINRDVEITEYDQKLFHLNCHKSAAIDQFVWHGDYGVFGSYMGSYALCPNCDGRLHSEYLQGQEYFDKDSPLSYKIVRADNMLFIGTKHQVHQQQRLVKQKAKAWDRQQTKKQKEAHDEQKVRSDE